MTSLESTTGTPSAAGLSWPEEIRRALSRLPGPQQAALELVYFAGLTQAEAAVQLAQPAGDVARHVAQGLQRLASYLE